MSRVIRKPVFNVSTRYDKNRTVQLCVARGLKFPILEEEGSYYLYSENIGALIRCTVTAQLICVFVFAYAKSKFSYDEAQT